MSEAEKETQQASAEAEVVNEVAVDDSPAEVLVEATTEVLSGEIETAEELVQAGGEQVVASVEDLNREIALLKKQLQEAQDKAIRQQAEVENARKRMQRDLEDAHKFAVKNFAVELLPVKDSMELHDTELLNAGKIEAEAINLRNLQEGSALILKMLNTALEKFNVEELNPLGEKFNPELHQAMAMMPSPDSEPNTVLIVHQKGYQLNGRLLRPALVIVSAAS